MTLSTTVSRIAHAGDGVSMAFAFPFKVWAASNLKVYLRDTAALTDAMQALGIDYTIDVTAYPDAGDVVFAVAPGVGQTVIILRDMPLTQELDLVPSGAFAAENIEVQLDKLAAEIQTLREFVARTPRLPVGTSLSDLALPEPTAAAANRLLGVTSAGDGFDLKAAADLSLHTVSPFIATLLDDADAEAARGTLEIASDLDLNSLPTDNAGGQHNDLVCFVDASEGFASNKVPVDVFFANVIVLGTDVALGGADQSNFRVLARRDSDGLLRKPRISGIGAGKQTIWVPAGAMTARVTNGPSAGAVETTINKIMIKTLDFDPATREYAQFSVRMPKSWNEGTVSATFYWSHASAAVNFGVVWSFEGAAISDGDALDAAFGTPQFKGSVGGATDRLYDSGETTAVALGGAPSEGDLAVFQVYRVPDHASDTLAVDARLHGVALFYATNANTDD